CAGAARLWPDLGGGAQLRRAQGAAAGGRVRARGLADDLPHARIRRRRQPAHRRGLGDDGNAGGGHRRGVLARARRAADVALADYAGARWARIRAPFFSPLLGKSMMGGVSFALIPFGTLLFTVVMSFLLLNMTKERPELQHKINALVDPRSGIPNRRAFLDG